MVLGIFDAGILNIFDVRLWKFSVMITLDIAGNDELYLPKPGGRALLMDCNCVYETGTGTLKNGKVDAQVFPYSSLPLKLYVSSPFLCLMAMYSTRCWRKRSVPNRFYWKNWLAIPAYNVLVGCGYLLH